MSTTTRRQFFKEATKNTFKRSGDTIELEYKDPSNKQVPRHLAKTSTGIDTYGGPWTENEVLHLLRRTMFGVTKSDIDFFKSMTMSQAVDYILNIPSVAPAPPVNNYSNAQNIDPNVAIGETWINAPINPNFEGLRIASWKSWWTMLMVNQDRNIREKMTLFWHNVFATETMVIRDSRYIYKHNALLRANCLSNFKTLVRDVTIDPAMLVYLNGELNTASAPDENYSRELQELFTIGKEINPHYTEEDVRAAARVLTGWRNNRNSIGPFFQANQHDTGNKQFSSFYNNTIITGRSGPNAGIDELNDLLNMIFTHPEVAKHICRELYRFFVYYVIDENVESRVIAPLADYFRNNNYDIKKVVEKLLKSEHFFDPLNNGCVIKSPVDFLIGTARMMNLQFPGTSNIQTQHAHYLYAQQYIALIGQNIGDPPDVAGWPAYRQSPQFYELWINSDSLPKRNQVNDLLLYTGFNRFGFLLKYNVIAFAEQFANPSNPNHLLNDILKVCYPLPVSEATKSAMKTAFLLSGQNSDHYWTDAWNDYKFDPTDSMKKAAVETRLQAMMKHIFGLAEYQLS
jgi:uncharacterized protein (DUF1800 family)